FFAPVFNELYESEKHHGLRARMGIKYYYKFTHRLAPYIGAEGMYNFIRHTTFEDVCRFGCQYVETMLIPMETTAAGGAFKTGVHFYPGKSKKVMFDFYTGLGAKMVHIKPSVPADSEMLSQPNNFDLRRTPGKYYLPDFLLGAYFGYSFF